MPSHSKNFPTAAVPLANHPATLPEVNIPDTVDVTAIASSALLRLQHATSDQFAENVIWRDVFALTGTLRTFFRPALVAKVWTDLTRQHKLSKLALTPGHSRIARYGLDNSWVEAGFTFDLQGGRPATCSGVIGLIPDGDPALETTVWKTWMISTTLEQPEGFPNVDKLEPIPRANGFRGVHVNGNAMEDREEMLDCIVVGAGMAGLCMAGRLQALGLSYVVIDKNSRVGDVWAVDRHESVKLHTTKAYNQLPGLPHTFRSEDPNLLRAKDLQEGFSRYVDTFGINVRTCSTLTKGSYDAERQYWTLSLQSHGDPIVLKARHVVLATGSQGTIPSMPEYANRNLYKGTILHGVDYRSAHAWKGKAGLVIGSANTAHDIISDMAQAGLSSVTMVQRSPTFLLPFSTWQALVDPIYNEHMPTEVADRILFGYPIPIKRLVGMNGIRACAEQRPEYYERIEANGFRTIRNGDLWGLLYDKEGGHFFDMGGGEYIANGSVKVRSDALPVSYTETGLRLDDGSRIDADVIVFATGYEGSLRSTAEKLFGDEDCGSLQEFWQCDEEGEPRGAWRETGRE